MSMCFHTGADYGNCDEPNLRTADELAAKNKADQLAYLRQQSDSTASRDEVQLHELFREQLNTVIAKQSKLMSKQS